MADKLADTFQLGGSQEYLGELRNEYAQAARAASDPASLMGQLPPDDDRLEDYREQYVAAHASNLDQLAARGLDPVFLKKYAILEQSQRMSEVCTPVLGRRALQGGGAGLASYPLMHMVSSSDQLAEATALSLVGYGAGSVVIQTMVNIGIRTRIRNNAPGYLAASSAAACETVMRGEEDAYAVGFKMARRMNKSLLAVLGTFPASIVLQALSGEA